MRDHKPTAHPSKKPSKKHSKKERANGTEGEEQEVPQEDAQAESQESHQEEAQNYKDQYLRTLAELQNLSARYEKQLREAHGRGARALAQDLLDSLDSLHRALQSFAETPEGQGASAPDSSQDSSQDSAQDSLPDSLRGGLLLVMQNIEETLARYGITPFSSLGQKLNPHRHEVMATLDSDAPAGTILQEVQRGWLAGDQLLRPARVVVAKESDSSTPNASNTEGET